MVGATLFICDLDGGLGMLNQLLKYTRSYLSGRISLNALEEWLVGNLQVILDSNEQKTIDIANELDADLAEYSEGIIDESTIREHLQSYIITTPIHYINVSGTTNLPDMTISDSTPVREFAIK